ncbi:MAG: Ribonuclease [Microgenomates bacterium OLB22]|nr:MAG: Ribonuclease [Microgenomates bacterium OLB22]
MVDFGMFQGLPELQELNGKIPQIPFSKLTGVLLTHAHLDHCGRLPILYRQGYSGKIYMTKATREILELTLLDTLKLARHGEGPVLFSEQDVSSVLRSASIVDYHVPFQLGSVTVEFFDAGHILGSASIVLTDATKKIVFSGDIGNFPEDIVRPTEFIKEADSIIMESTYGDRLHPVEDVDALLGEQVKAIEQSGGTLLIPSFSIERTQDLLHRFDHLKTSRKIAAQTKIYLDSPMGSSVTDIYEKHPELYNDELSEHARHDNPFNFQGFHEVRDSKESQSIHHEIGPKVIIAGSGMMNGGRILSHAKFYLPSPSTRLLFVGFQAEGTMGRRIIEGAEYVLIDGTEVLVRAEVAVIHALSAHADQKQLLDWFGHISSPQKVFLVHGENPAREVLGDLIKHIAPKVKVHMPDYEEEISL